MTRKLLAATMTLGLLVTTLGFTGVFAVFSDRATTGTNSGVSGEQQRVAELKINRDTSSVPCDTQTYVDDLTTGDIQATGLLPGEPIADIAYVCLRNDGSAALDISYSVIDLVDTETDCTGDEGVLDQSCGTSGTGDGELSTALQVEALRYDCNTFEIAVNTTADLVALRDTPAALGSLDPDEVACIKLGIYIPNAGSQATADEILVAQTDRSDWRFAFDGVVP